MWFDTFFIWIIDYIYYMIIWQPSGTWQCIIRLADVIGHNYQHHRNIHMLVWWCDGTLFRYLNHRKCHDFHHHQILYWLGGVIRHNHQHQRHIHIGLVLWWHTFYSIWIIWKVIILTSCIGLVVWWNTFSGSNSTFYMFSP